MNLPKRIQRKRTKGYKTPRNTCYCGRGRGEYGKWGNQFVVGKYLSRYQFVLLNIIKNDFVDTGIITLELSLKYYKLWLDWEIRLYNLNLTELLKYDYLSCWCPLTDKKGNKIMCHVDILINKLKELIKK